MSRRHLLTLAVFASLLILFQFGFRNKPTDLIQKERERSLNIQPTSVSILREEAWKELDGNERATIQILENRLKNEQDTVSRVSIMEELSSTWYDYKRFSMAGAYAEQIGEIQESPEAWAIAGTTYAICLNNAQSEKERLFCRAKSLESLEKAISLDPSVVEYQLNRAVVLAEHPSAENPMQGILLLRELNKKFPKNVAVMNNLARFAIQTNQPDRALARLKQAEKLAPENKLTLCLMAEAYRLKGMEQEQRVYQDKCNLLN